MKTNRRTSLYTTTQQLSHSQNKNGAPNAVPGYCLWKVSKSYSYRRVCLQQAPPDVGRSLDAVHFNNWRPKPYWKGGWIGFSNRRIVPKKVSRIWDLDDNLFGLSDHTMQWDAGFINRSNCGFFVSCFGRYWLITFITTFDIVKPVNTIFSRRCREKRP